MTGYRLPFTVLHRRLLRRALLATALLPALTSAAAPTLPPDFPPLPPFNSSPTSPQTPAQPQNADPAAPLTLPAPAASPGNDGAGVQRLSQIDSYTISVADMGQRDGLTLSGGQMQSGIRFTLPHGQVVTQAKLYLVFRTTSTLAEEGNQLSLMLNGQPLGDIPLAESSSAPNTYELDIPAALVVSNNNLSFSIHNQNSLLCETSDDNRHQVSILPETRIEMANQLLNIDKDLGYFPRPFFDPMVMGKSAIPMVFGSTPSSQSITAATIVASILGLHANYRDIEFPVYQNTLPENNAIIFAMPGENIAGLSIPDNDGPAIQIIDNPINPLYKLLLVTGRNEDELRQAAYRLASAPLPAGQDRLLVPSQPIPLRQPYDAPRWINTERPVTFRELVSQPDDLIAEGVYHDSIHINFRAAPDLFMWDGQNIPVRINYRFPTGSWIDEDASLLNVSLNGTFLRNLPVNKIGLLESAWRRLGGDTRQESYRLELAPYLIYGDNQMDLYHNIKPRPGTPCEMLRSDNIKSTIDGNSSIDLSGSHHFSMLPNLSYYVGAAFPFSKMADFSHTWIVLAEKPDAAEIGTLLNLAARAGKATGVAIGHVKIRLGLSNVAALADSDVLIVASLTQTALMRQLLHSSPYNIDNARLSLKTPSIWDKLRRYLSGQWSQQYLAADRYLSSIGAWRGFLSFPSPWAANRLVVVATGSNDGQIEQIDGDLNSTKINAGIRGDMAVITPDGSVRSFNVSPQYPDGQMPWYLMVIWYANQHVAVLSFLAVLISVLIGIPLYRLLSRHAQQRLARTNRSNTPDGPV
ncbi:cellulose biosynthesis cyclic di-GMP-binding regulatory protein BcsB [Brenneria goodwinii]|uniref:cellulose biosynthesis cyclic di-GMP-binding regulatory protein BcsB n=1 Tax=Brenneria goodwinii TaxID=1109412 RepID=UPI000EF27535|nr:cellulose biosynthesis cyclic di-GMP-binding regulatory protein BcsB [Brenneria goodwinii]MCG8155628.1 cellulose biosynthesis cyclic di-GMP-binding regulatory protein BcsB [Brenneria goodwinii]MCG8160345.1 cellulose biosynthesis cyclic di-GMP-binding regulatory protein BcsB [Brenneria goodwinii]MCG8164868.1 cellulose biosynthesis cyclic di-GMP-binding regulatory protein BcsB [Brenneria goodwinii]MCG8169475.1 cellulose biosynthesis cyclic di-GMP-binding regulatory protein BcsB [Brenneria good